ncbi:cyclic nucleotide-binding/CBS domain-containing protein [Planctomycetes bacterium K23_9]|uniref:Inosine 5-monophosphate dehydrogenase n=1 Tax=Stieleria marina TaxID=1930275 RepID=A0A517NSR8_9BACT|nr:inosine 5-monophosphate dehydrogenase [Planctomycetes bacterium K23_9]
MLSFKEDLASTPVSALATREAIVVQPGTVVRAAIAQMRAHSLGCAVIVDYSQHPIGIFTEQSIIKLLARGVSLDNCPVQDFADPTFLSVNHADPIEHVWDAIQQDGVRFVCVIDDDGKLIGITGQRGVAEYVADCFATQVTVQRLGSTPWMQQREGA